jgi:hypothetical protein
MTLSNQDLVLLSTLLDEAIDLTEAEQEAWLRGGRTAPPGRRWGCAPAWP